MANLFCPATGFESEQDWVLEHVTGQLTTVTHPPVSHPITAWNTTSKPTWTDGDSSTSAVCSLWLQPRVCLGRKWICEKQDRVLSALYWRLGSMLNLWHVSTVRAICLASLLFAVGLWSLHIQLIYLYLLCGPGLDPPLRPWRSLVERVWGQISN